MAREPQKAKKPRAPASNRKPRGFGEAQTPFGRAGTGLYAIFVAYDFRCAFTAADLTAEIKADPAGALLRLRGASNAAGDVVPACLDAIYAFERGHLALGPSYEFIVALDRINPEFLETLAPNGRLQISGPAKFYPRKSLLQTHRRAMVDARLN